MKTNCTFFLLTILIGLTGFNPSVFGDMLSPPSPQSVKAASALIEAINQDDIKKVETLIQQGANVNARYNTHGTVLMVATEHGNIEIVKLLLKNGASLTSRHFGHRPIQIAAKNGQKDLIALFIEKRTYRERSPFEPKQYAVEKTPVLAPDGTETFILTQREYIPDIKHENITEALIAAAENGRDDVINWLFENYIAVNETENEFKEKYKSTGIRALIEATRKKHISTVELLLDKGVDINATYLLEETALMHAVKRKHFDIVATLIQRGADVNKVNFQQNTALVFAVENNAKEIVELLLQNGANASVLYYNKTPLLTYALEKEDKTISDLLIKYGATK